VWLNGANDWIYRHLHKAEERMVELAGRAAGKKKPAAAVQAALQQAARELLLAQISDWAFLMATGGSAPYAEKRTRNHLHSFTRLYEMVRSGNVDRKYVESLRAMNPVFPDLDWRAFL